MCEQPETDMVSGFFHGSAATGWVQATFHFATLPFAGRLKTKFAYKKQPAPCCSKCRLLLVIDFTAISFTDQLIQPYSCRLRSLSQTAYACLLLDEHIALRQNPITITAAMMIIPYGIMPSPFSYTARPPGKPVRAVLATVWHAINTNTEPPLPLYNHT